MILITGASSYVGAKIYTDSKNYEVMGTYYSNKLFDELIKLDITDEPQVSKLINEIKPDTIIHVAANPSQSWCKEHKDLAISINEKGTEYIVNAANNNNSKIIYISSFAAINPKSLYGEIKLNSEEHVKKTEAGYVILRPSLIVGYSPNTKNDRPFNRILRNLTENNPAIYDDSRKFQPTWLKHLSEISYEVIERNITNETIPVAVPEVKSRFEIAKDILTPFGKEVKPEYKYSKDSSSQDLSKLEELNLPKYSYSKMINGIIEEIRENLTL